MNEIPFRGTYDRQTFFRAVRLANQPAVSQRWVQPVMIITVLVALGVLVFRLVQTRDVLGNASFIAVLMIILAFVLRTSLMPFLAARNLWSNPSLKDELLGSVGQNGIRYHLKLGENKMTWERFVRIRQDPGLTTIVARDGLLLVFPRRFFQSDRDWVNFNQLLNSKIINVR